MTGSPPFTETEQQLLARLQQAPESVHVTDVLAVIEAGYEYVPTTFTNGAGPQQLVNPAGTNEVSCRLFAFAALHRLPAAQTLACFGHYYRDDVLADPDGQNHGNIRAFMRHGWDALHFEGDALRPRQR
ncbi:HopJ type III effector protein [Isoalcanivorax indicus]|uniref:HopJ type III effector protein n=1 Tax=Isoalcanivorax indicus TaxID=2202653 RepID=UPI000DBA3058|nr:HopJ type III effector protein [Isoalcanivorax indicus]